jgi:leader peptidase (prepilin peptidase)/N-methyltransferase
MMLMPLWFLVVSTAAVGLCIGSFLNVVAYRVPAGLSVAHPRSACPGCSEPIGSRDNIPVVSWLVLRGRCRHCSSAISARYPAIESLTAVLFILAAVRLGWSPTLPAVLVFFAGLVALAACDLEHYLLPRKIVYPTGILAGGALLVAAADTGQWHRITVAAVCAAVAFALFFAINFVNPRWLGFGDVRLMAVIGLVLGWFGPLYLLVALLAANASGLVVIVGLMAAGRAQRDTPIPYGVFLAAGAILAVLVGGPLVSLLTTYR